MVMFIYNLLLGHTWEKKGTFYIKHNDIISLKIQRKIVIHVMILYRKAWPESPTPNILQATSLEIGCRLVKLSPPEV